MRMTDPVILLRGRRTRAVLYLLFVTTAIVVSIVGATLHDRPEGIVMAIVFALPLALCVYRLTPNAVWLRIDQVGIEWRYLWMRKALSWQDVRVFELWWFPYYRTFERTILIQLSKSYQMKHSGRLSWPGSYGAQLSLPGSKFTVPVERLCAVLNARKQLWAEQHPEEPTR